MWIQSLGHFDCYILSCIFVHNNPNNLLNNINLQYEGMTLRQTHCSFLLLFHVINLRGGFPDLQDNQIPHASSCNKKKRKKETNILAFLPYKGLDLCWGFTRRVFTPCLVQWKLEKRQLEKRRGFEPGAETDVVCLQESRHRAFAIALSLCNTCDLWYSYIL